MTSYTNFGLSVCLVDILGREIERKVRVANFRSFHWNETLPLTQLACTTVQPVTFKNAKETNGRAYAYSAVDVRCLWLGNGLMAVCIVLQGW